MSVCRYATKGLISAAVFLLTIDRPQNRFRAGIVKKSFAGQGTSCKLSLLPIIRHCLTITSKDVVRIDKKVEYPITSDFHPRDIVITGNRKIVYGSFSEGNFGTLDEDNNIITSQYDLPFKYDNRVTGINKGTTYQYKIEANPKQNKFAVLTLASDIFEIYNVTNDRQIDRIYTSPFQNISQITEVARQGFTVDSGKSIAGLLMMSVSEDLICFAYSSQTHKDALNSGLNFNEILCFNWTGEKVKKIILPFSINNFCIDTHYIYGVKDYTDKAVLYRFCMI